VQLAVDRDLLQHLAPVDLEAAVEVVQVDLRQLPRHPVEQQRRQALRRRVLPAPLPPGDEIEVVLLEHRQQAGDLLRVVLEVAVHGHDDLPAAVVEAGRQGRRLAEVAAQAHQLDARVALARPAPALGGGVGRAVVDEDDLEAPAEPVEDAVTRAASSSTESASS
jgi:hypothetical protein